MTGSQEHVGPSGNGIVFVAFGIFAAVVNRTTRGGSPTTLTTIV
jgi:hypothetical protein